MGCTFADPVQISLFMGDIAMLPLQNNQNRFLGRRNFATMFEVRPAPSVKIRLVLHLGCSAPTTP